MNAHCKSEVRLDKLIIIVLFLLYPLFIRFSFLEIKFQYILNLAVIFLMLTAFYRFKINVNQSVNALLPLILWMIIVLILGLFSDFQKNNPDLQFAPSFAINADGETGANYYNVGNRYHNTAYMIRMIFFIPLSMIIGSSISTVDSCFFKKVIRFFLIISAVVIIFQYFFFSGDRLSGFYSNPQDMSAIVLFFITIYICLAPSNSEFYFSILISFVVIWLTGTRSSLLVFVTFLMLRKWPKFYLVLALFFTLLISFLTPVLGLQIPNIDFTSLSSTLIRIDLWANYLWPNIAKSPIVGLGVIPIVTENLLIFFIFVYGLVGAFLFSYFLYKLCFRQGINCGNVTLIVSVVIFQSIYFMGLLSLDNLVMTFFTLGYFSVDRE